MWFMYNPESVLENSLGFSDTNKSPNLDQTTRPSDSQQKKKKKKKKKNQ